MTAHLAAKYLERRLPEGILLKPLAVEPYSASPILNAAKRTVTWVRWMHLQFVYNTLGCTNQYRHYSRVYSRHLLAAGIE